MPAIGWGRVMIGIESTGSVTVGFSGDRAAEGPLTFAQRDTLAWITEPDDAASALLRWTFELPDGARMADVTSAFAILLARHEALRTTYVVAEAPVQRVARSGELVISTYRIIGEFDQDKVAQQLLDELCEQGIDFTVDLPLRVAVAGVGEWPRVAVAVYSHMAADFGTTVVIGRQFTELVGDPAARVVGPKAHQPLDQAHLENSPRGRRRSEAAIRHWRTQVGRAPHAVCSLPAPSGDALGPRASGHRTCVLVSPAAALALGRIEARTRLGRQAVVLAAICALLARRTAVDGLAFVSISGNRFHSRLGEYVGDLAQDGLIALDLDAAGFDELIGRAAGATLIANANSSYDPQALNDMLDEVGHARGAVFARDFVVNNLSVHVEAAMANQQTDLRPAAGDDYDGELARALELCSLTWRPAPDFPEMLLCVPVRVDSEFIFTLTGDTAYLAEAELEQLVRGLERLVVAAADRDIPLAELGAVTGVEPVRRGPDWVRIDSSWIHLPAVRRLLLDALNAPAAHVFVGSPEHGDQGPATLIGYVTATDAIRSPHRAHLACMELLAEPGRHLAMAPSRYVLCDGVPEDPADESSWRRLEIVAVGGGREAMFRR
jgi:hypothetical protein